MILTIITVFILFSILVLIHEFGHFFVAKKSGMKVEEFGFGLPPRLWGIKKGGTIYSLNWLPFGGFVKIYGEDPEDTANHPSALDLKRAFNHKPWYLRASVIIAGPIMNFLLAVVIISYLFTKGLYLPTNEVKITNVVRNSPAAKAGLKANDLVLSVKNNKETITINSSALLIDTMKNSAGKEAILKIERSKNIIYLKVTPRKNPPKGQGALGIVISDIKFQKYPWYQAPFVGLKKSLEISVLYYKELFKIFSKLAVFKNPQVEVAGPIGIAKLTGEAVQSGFTSVLQLLALLSLNLALVNIFPFPALDGGQLVFVLAEAITRRKINENLKAQINTVGFAVLMGLILLITVQDVVKLFVK